MSRPAPVRDAGETVVTIRLAETAGRTALTTTVRFPSHETRDTVLTSGLDSGVGQNYERLADVLAAWSSVRRSRERLAPMPKPATKWVEMETVFQADRQSIAR